MIFASEGKVLTCNHCKNETYMKIVAYHIHNHTHEYSEERNYEEVTCTDLFQKDEYSLFFCPVCSNVTLELKEINYNNEKTKLSILYPLQRDSLDDIVLLQIRQSYISAQKVYEIDKAICLIALRRTLEMICKDKGKTSGNLYEKLTKLSNKQILPPILSNMAGILRDKGNSAAHGDIQDFPDRLVFTLMEFTKSILEYVYVLPNKIQEIQKEQ